MRSLSHEQGAVAPELAATTRRNPRSWPEILLLVVQCLLLLAMTITVVTKIWQDHVWFGWALVAVTCLAWLPEATRKRDRRWWFVYVAGTFIYTLLRSYADDTGMPLQTMYVIHIDHFLFFGNDPSVWLQNRLFSTSKVTLLDVAAVQVHWSFFIAPHAAAVIIFIWKRQLFPRYVALVVGTLYAGLALFFLLPTTPPWLAGRDGVLPGAYRVMDFVGGKVSGDTYRTLSTSIGEPNPVAAMPSIHEAVTFAMYLYARDHEPRLAPWLLVYCVVMAVSLVYLAEHYVADLVAGVLCAILCHALSRRFVAAPSRQTVMATLPLGMREAAPEV
ncbi:MAG: phosphatase PAP2 family protein [Tepidiformaceae bacterium]